MDRPHASIQAGPFIIVKFGCGVYRAAPPHDLAVE